MIYEESGEVTEAGWRETIRPFACTFVVPVKSALLIRDKVALNTFEQEQSVIYNSIKHAKNIWRQGMKK